LHGRVIKAAMVMVAA